MSNYYKTASNYYKTASSKRSPRKTRRSKSLPSRRAPRAALPRHFPVRIPAGDRNGLRYTRTKPTKRRIFT